MELPKRFPYNPRWAVLVFSLVAGVAMIAIAYFKSSFWICVPLGILLGIPGLIGIPRRLVAPGFVELGKDAIVLRMGLRRRRTVRIPYADIEYAQAFAARTISVLRIRTTSQSFEFNSALLPHMEAFKSISDFITSLPRPKELESARKDQPVEPGKYCLNCAYEGNGAIYDSKGGMLWRTKTGSDFVVYDPTEKEIFRIKRERSFWLVRSVMLEDGVPVCRIRQRSLLLNRYTLVLTGRSKWTFKMPLFSVNFEGVSETGARVRARVWTHNTWYIFIDPEADNPRLIGALAFIHKERLRCN